MNVKVKPAELYLDKECYLHSRESVAIVYIVYKMSSLLDLSAYKDVRLLIISSSGDSC